MHYAVCNAQMYCALRQNLKRQKAFLIKKTSVNVNKNVTWIIDNIYCLKMQFFTFAKFCHYSIMSVNLNAKFITILLATLQFLFINILSHFHFIPEV